MPLYTDISSTHPKGILIINLEKTLSNLKWNLLVDVPFLVLKSAIDMLRCLMAHWTQW